LDNRLQANLAIFQSDYDDYIANSQDLAATPPVVISGNVGEAEIKGVELSLDWAVTDQLSVGLNGSVVNAEFVAINSASTVANNIEGDYLPFVPKYGYSLNTNYSFNWSDSVAGNFRLSYNREGESTSIDRAAGFVPDTIANDSFGFLDLQLSTQFQTVSLELFGQNILDEDKNVGVSLTRQTPQARPRTLGLRLSYDF